MTVALAVDGDGEASEVGTRAMFPKVDPLPGPQDETVVRDGDTEIVLSQN